MRMKEKDMIMDLRENKPAEVDLVEVEAEVQISNDQRAI